jgi:hypothetical protein
MRISKLIIAALLLLSMWTNTIAQERLGHLRNWDGQYPTYNKLPQKFFDLPEVRRPLKKLLSQRVYYLLTKGHTKEGPIKIIDHYLKVKVCGSPKSYACDNATILVIDLNDGSMYVAFDVFSRRTRYFSTKGKFTDLPQNVQSLFEIRGGT